MQCCLPYITGEKIAATAEALMRSRYTAYVNDEYDYLVNTWHVSTRPATLDLDDTRPDKWLGLKIVNTTAGGVTDTGGEVEFIAKYKFKGKAYRLHEKSRFLKEAGKWYYLDGEITE